MFTLNQFLDNFETRERDNVHDGRRFEMLSRLQKQLNDGSEPLLPTRVLALEAYSEERHLVSNGIEEGQTVAGTFENAIDAVHQFLVEAVNGVGIVERQQAEEVTDLVARLSRALRNVKVEQLLEESLLKH